MCPEFLCMQGQLDGSALLLLLLAALFSGVFHTISGFAGGILLSLLVAPIIGVAAVVPVLSVALTISAVSRAWIFRNLVDWTSFLLIMIPALPFIIIGALIYGRLNSHTISIILGFFLICSVFWRWVFANRGKQVGKVGLSIAGAFFGLISGISIGGGMLLAPFLLGRGLRKEHLAAIFAMIGLTLNLTKTGVFTATQVLPAEDFVLGVVIGFSTIPGTIMAKTILNRTSVRVHTLWIETLVLIGGMGFILNGIGAFL